MGCIPRRKALRVTYAPGPNAGLTTESLYAKARALAKTPGGILKSVGDVTSPLSGTVVTAMYETQYLAHAPMEPMNTTADVRADRVTVWTPTQAQTKSQQVAATITGLPISAVTVNTTFRPPWRDRLCCRRGSQRRRPPASRSS